MHGYVYMTINILNGKRYIGKRVSNKFETPSVYVGSGKYLLRSLYKNGIDVFSKELLDTANSKEELDRKEIYWIEYYNAVEDPMFYNLAEGGKGGNPISGKTKEEIESYKRKVSENHADVSGKNNPMYGIKRIVSNETRKKLSVSQKKRFEDPNQRLKMNTMKNASKETLRKLSISTSNRNKNRIWIYKDNITKYIDKSELEYYLLIGYSKGRGKSAKYSREVGLGRHWINNGVVNKFVKDEEIEKYLSDGFVRGKLIIK